MQYNSQSEEQDIVTMSEKLVSANSVSFPIKEKTLYANQACRLIWSWIHEAYGGWMYDDNNNTDFPEATTTLNADQADYALPTEASFINGVSIKDEGGIWHKLQPITLEQIQDIESESEFMKTSSIPLYYRMLAKSIKLYPAPNYTQAASLKIHETREISGFSITDTTKKPGFDSQYHEAVPTYMALQYAKINGLSNKNDLMNDWLVYEKIIKSDYRRRFAELFPARITVRDITRDYE